MDRQRKARKRETADAQMEINYVASFYFTKIIKNKL